MFIMLFYFLSDIILFSIISRFEYFTEFCKHSYLRISRRDQLLFA